jgi:hypothetical protein
MGPVTRHMPHRHRLVKQFDLVKDDVITSHELTDQFQSGDLLRIRSCGHVESIQGIKVKLQVPAPLGFGSQNLTGGELTRRPETVGGDNELRMKPCSNKGVQRCGSSPGCSRDARICRLRPETSSNSRIPASTCERERRIAVEWSYPSSIPSLEMK